MGPFEREVGFYDKLKQRREEMNLVDTVHELRREVRRLEDEQSEMKNLLIKSMSQMQEIY